MPYKQELPPFIHYSIVERGSQDGNQKHQYPEPLANFQCFIPMFQAKTPNNSKFVYSALFLEARRLHNEFRTFDEWTKIAALQAVSLYIILLASDSDQCITLNTVLVLSMMVIAANLQQMALSNKFETNEAQMSWKEWILAESKRRTIALIWLIQEVIDVHIGVLPTAASCFDVDSIALPDRKGLWEATTGTEWEKEYKEYASTRKSRSTLRIKDLRCANANGGGARDKFVQTDLENWASQTDSFGSLLLLLTQ